MKQKIFKWIQFFLSFFISASLTFVALKLSCDWAGWEVDSIIYLPPLL